MIKIAAIIIAAAFSTGYAVDVDEVPVESPAANLTVESPVDLAPQEDHVAASIELNQCLAQCDVDNWICTQDCSTPLCHIQCDNITRQCQHNCYASY